MREIIVDYKLLARQRRRLVKIADGQKDCLLEGLLELLAAIEVGRPFVEYGRGGRVGAGGNNARQTRARNATRNRAGSNSLADPGRKR